MQIELRPHDIRGVSKRSGACSRLLGGRQEPSRRRGGWEPEEGDYAHDYGQGAFDDEEPLPAVDPWAVDLEDAVGDEAAECGCEEGGAKEDCDAEAEFAARVEEGEVEDYACEEACFGCAGEVLVG